MTDLSNPLTFFLGWDVGGWNCDRNFASRDAIVILDSSRTMVGRPWRGNLRTCINEFTDARHWIRTLFELCRATLPAGSIRCIMAIDTPLGFPSALADLMSGDGYTALLEDSSANPYLFRVTEQFLFEQGLRPLSPVKDMIGSQATKGMHVLAKMRVPRIHAGLWVDGDWLAVIETYPAPCKNSALINSLLQPFIIGRADTGETLWFDQIRHADMADALICALVAYCFDVRRDELARPIENVPEIEGWIWLPNDVMATPDEHSKFLGWNPMISTDRAVE
jgi:hypothetical protein